MAIDPNTLSAGTITHETHGTTFAGESATRLFQVRVIMRSLEFEHRTGLRMTGKRSVADAARALLGSTTRNKAILLLELQQLADKLAANVTVK